MLTKRPLYLYLAASIAFTGFAQSASATLVGAEQVAHAGVAATAAGAAQARAHINSALSRPEVQAELVRQGVDPTLAMDRVAALSDADAARLAAQIDTAPAGGDGVLGVILVVFLVLLITDILGFTHIFPFTRSVR